MKILHLIDSFDARFDRDQIKLAELLEKKGYSNIIITSRYSSDWSFTKKSQFRNWERKKFSQTEIIHAISARILTPFSKIPSPIYLPSRQVLEDFDIIHAYTFGTYSSLLSAALKKIKNSKLVVRSDLSLAAYNKTKNALFYRTMLTCPFKMAEAVYAYSDLEKRYLISLGVQQSKIWVIPPGIDYSKFSKDDAITRNRASLKIGYLGRFCFIKGVHRVVPTLITFLREREDIQVVFTGMLDDIEYAKNVMYPLRKFRNFKYLSDLSTSSSRFYSMCDIILIPSISETGAITVLEAMASGKVVIASNINPINEYVQNGFNGFLFNSDQELYEHLKKLVMNPVLIKNIGRKARENAERYDWRLVVRKYEEMYQSVLEEG